MHDINTNSLDQQKSAFTKEKSELNEKIENLTSRVNEKERELSYLTSTQESVSSKLSSKTEELEQLKFAYNEEKKGSSD